MRLTKEEILAMEAGRELDVLTFTSVIKEKYKPFINKQGDAEYPIVPKYSSDISAAWEVFQKFGYPGTIGFSGSDYFCDIMIGFKDEGSYYGEANGCQSAPEAICKAALLGVME